ncbi:MAG TPA: hypothetical protein VND93_28480, partial [Myxococcales bacterium]|nr:hypothetical protein [Myxococcales bacterium]
MPPPPELKNPRRALKELAAVGAALGEQASARALALAMASPDPDALIAAFERAVPAIQGALAGRDAVEVVELLAPLLEASELAGRTLAARPGLLRWLLGSRSLRSPRDGAAAAAQARAAARVARAKGHEALL